MYVRDILGIIQQQQAKTNKSSGTLCIDCIDRFYFAHSKFCKRFSFLTKKENSRLFTLLELKQTSTT